MVRDAEVHSVAAWLDEEGHPCAPYFPIPQALRVNIVGRTLPLPSLDAVWQRCWAHSPPPHHRTHLSQAHVQGCIVGRSEERLLRWEQKDTVIRDSASHPRSEAPPLCRCAVAPCFLTLPSHSLPHLVREGRLRRPAQRGLQLGHLQPLMGGQRRGEGRGGGRSGMGSGG